MKKSSDDILRTIERFMAGETSLAEERELFTLFEREESLDPALEPYRAMMQWYGGLGDTDGAAPAHAAPQRRRVSPVLTAWMTAAAAVAMLVTVAVSYISDVAVHRNECLAYAGSYVIRNGVKETDVSRILQELKSVDAIVAGSHQLAGYGSVSAGNEDGIILDTDAIDLSDPEVAALVRQVMDNE